MTYVMVRHKVADFDEWKAAYDAHAAERAKAGLEQLHLMRNIDDPDEIVLLFAAQEFGKAKAFTLSEDLRKRMKKAGVKGKPEIWYLQ